MRINMVCRLVLPLHFPYSYLDGLSHRYPDGQSKNVKQRFAVIVNVNYQSKGPYAV